MASGSLGKTQRLMRTLLEDGASGALTDDQLLARFLDSRGDSAELAFEALVARHGPLVFDVCRNSLPRIQDVEDAFQATFLVLACKASTIRRRDSLPSWLFGVARRVSARIRSDAARRLLHERQLTKHLIAVPQSTSNTEDLSIVLEEVERLPSKYRDPVILCYLQGISYQAAAERLSCPVGTLSVRLNRAREQLRRRLTRRGLANFSAFLVAGKATPTALAASLAASATQIAVQSIRDQSLVTAAAAATIAALARRTLTSASLTKLNIVAAALLSLALGVSFLGSREPAVGSDGTDTPKPAQISEPELDLPSLRSLVEASEKDFEDMELDYEGTAETVGKGRALKLLALGFQGAFANRRNGAVHLELWEQDCDPQKAMRKKVFFRTENDPFEKGLSPSKSAKAPSPYAPRLLLQEIDQPTYFLHLFRKPVLMELLRDTNGIRTDSHLRYESLGWTNVGGQKCFKFQFADPVVTKNGPGQRDVYYLDMQRGATAIRYELWRYGELWWALDVEKVEGFPLGDGRTYWLPLQGYVHSYFGGMDANRTPPHVIENAPTLEEKYVVLSSTVRLNQSLPDKRFTRDWKIPANVKTSKIARMKQAQSQQWSQRKSRERNAPDRTEPE